MYALITKIFNNIISRLRTYFCISLSIINIFSSMTCEVFESVGSIYVEIPVSPKPSPPGSSRSSVEFWEDSTKMDEPDDGQCNLRSEAVNHMLSWVSYSFNDFNNLLFRLIACIRRIFSLIEIASVRATKLRNCYVFCKN
jgi:hypothetical protein